MKDSQTDEENSFFPPRSEEVYLLERRIFVLLTKETNEEMEIKDTHIYMQAARISNRPVLQSGWLDSLSASPPPAQKLVFL